MKGFTLIELLLVLGIFLLIGILSAPFYSRFLTQSAVSNTVDQLVQDVRKAQFYAEMSKNSNSSGWGVNYGSSTITVYQGASYASRNTALDQVTSINSNITVTGLSDLNFSRVKGIPSSGVFPMTIAISGQGNSKTITVNGQGVVTR